MFDFNEMLRQAQGGQALFNLARHFGLTPEETAKVVEAVMPAFMSAMQRQMSDPAFFLKLTQAMSGQVGSQGPYFDPMKAFSPESRAAGESFMSTLFGSKEVASAVSEQAARMAGIGQSVMQSMMPVLASMTASGLGTFLTSSPFAKMMEPYLGKASGGAQMPDFSTFFSPKGMENGVAEFWKALGNPTNPGDLAATFDTFMKTTPNPAGPNTPFGDLMGEFVKGFNRGRPEKAEPEPEPASAPDVFSQMLKAGQDVQDSQAQAFEEIFDRFWGRRKA